jgi:hypothetical protein
VNFLRLHWYDLGMGLAAATGAMLLIARPQGLSLLLWISLISLFFHQAEEYRFPGTFPGMMNKLMFASTEPDRYPLNPNTALIVNVAVGWLSYFLAALLAGRAIWLAVATMTVSVGNFVAHTFLFNIRGKTRYNPGMLTAVLLFLPISACFFYVVIKNAMAPPLDWIGGILLGIALNYLGILKLIDLLKNRSTRHVFPPRNIRAI